MKILICSENNPLMSGLAQALKAAGHDVLSEANPSALAAAAAQGGALIVDPARAKRAMAHLRDRGFAGRALVASSAAQEELARQAEALGADGALSLLPANDLVRRFARAVGGSRRVLVLEADPTVALSMKEELEKGGYKVVCVSEVGEATSLLLHRATRPDLVLVAADLPKVSGVKFCHFLKVNERFCAVKVVLCGEASRLELEQLANECGADGVMTRRELLGEPKAKTA